MTDFNLIDYVVPKGGIYCVVGMGADDSFRPKFTSDREEVDELVEHFVEQDANVYFALAKLNNSGRKAEDVESLQSIWVDLDCGPDKVEDESSTGLPKGYATKREAQVALKSFCGTTGLPIPAVIDSGGGIHAYWALTEEVPRDNWQPIIDRLKQVCVTQKFYADPNVFDSSRVLRVPGTYNHKYDPPALVKVLWPAAGRSAPERITPEELRDILGVDANAVAVQKGPRELDPLEELLQGNYDNEFKKIVTRADGCLQLQDSLRNRTTLAEPRWFNALSVAKFCKDRAKAAYTLSQGHPDYSAEATEKKMEGIKGPHSCEEFEGNNPGGCKGCKHKGKVTSPINLGQIIKVSKSSPHKYFGSYVRGEKGGIFIEVQDEVKLVYEYDLYIEQRMVDPNDGDVSIFKLHTPRDGVREFTVPNEKLEPRELSRLLAKHGVVAGKENAALLHKYIIDAVKNLQSQDKADLMRVQFGWADNDTKFIVGEREVTVDNEYHSPPSTITDAYSRYLEPKGTLEKWQEVFNIYNREGLEIQAFAALSGFGAALLKFTGQKGAIINLVHPHAGTGKTTVLRMANSIAGDPEMMLGTPDDTAVGRVNKLGTLNNIVNTMDELTNLKDEEIGKFAYAASQGKGKEKAQMHINANRKNEITWRNITLTSSNASFYQKLMNSKNAPDGELMRIIEFVLDYQDLNIVSTQEGKDMFDLQLNENFGHAIVPFIQYVMSRPDHMLNTLKGVQRKIDKELRLTQRERNWSAILAANITAGILATEIGLINFNMKRIFHRVSPVLINMRKETVAPSDGNPAVISEFVSKHIHNCLVIDAGVDKRTSKLKRPIQEPRGPLVMRHEPDTKITYIPVGKFKEDIGLRQVDYNKLIKELTASGACIRVFNKDMGKGLPMATGVTRCIWIDSSHADFQGGKTMQKYIEEGSEDGSGEGEVPD